MVTGSSSLRRWFALALVGGVLGSCGDPAPDAPSDRAGAPSAPEAGTPPARDTLPDWRSAPGAPSLDAFVETLARDAAARPYRPRPVVVTEAVAGLSYGQYRGIRFRPEATVWRDAGPFQLQFFHPGGGFTDPVRIHLVEGEASEELPFEPERFDYGWELEGADVTLPPGAGYAGFKVLFPLNRPEKMDEVVSFLGASYFRLLGPGHVYGLSSRGLAVNTAGPGGEEFPDFTDFWLVRPEPGDSTLTFHAFLDSPSVTGAYRFVLAPGRPDGPPTTLEVDARLFAREALPRLGVAPLTSMYLHGTLDPGGEDDFRPRVHDSQGLQLRTGGGEWIWRPLTNRDAFTVTGFQDDAPGGFGLVQRDRDFESYLDLETRYDARPSEWVAPLDGDWGPGAVELVEIPTNSEFNDNIVAYWAPEGGIPAGEARRYRYRLVLFDDRLPEGGAVPGSRPRSRVTRMRVGWDALPGQAEAPPRAQRRFVLDFAGEGLTELATDERVDASLSTSSGTLSDLRVEPLPGGGWRATFALLPEDGQPADLRLALIAVRETGAGPESTGDSVAGGSQDTEAGFRERAESGRSERPISETWSYLWTPAP